MPITPSNDSGPMPSAARWSAVSAFASWSYRRTAVAAVSAKSGDQLASRKNQCVVAL